MILNSKRFGDRITKKYHRGFKIDRIINTAHSKYRCKYHYIICTKVYAQNNIWEDKERYWRNTEEIMRTKRYISGVISR